MPRSILPEITTSLNVLSGVFILLGVGHIRKGRRQAHMRSMLTALGFSVLFMLFYLLRVYLEGTHHFPGHGLLRTVYLTILATHTILAMIVVPLVGITLYRAYKGRFDRHRRIARITVPVWLYVSFTGPIIYVMLYWLA